MYRLKAGTDIMIYRKTTKEILGESLHELAHSKNVDKITVKEITDNCEMSPGTFYHHFHDKYDLIAGEYAEATAKIMGHINGSSYPWRQTLLAGAGHYAAQKDYLTNLFLHTSGHDSFIRYMTEINYAALKKHLGSLQTGEEGEKIWICISASTALARSASPASGFSAGTPRQRRKLPLSTSRRSRSR